MKYRTKQGDVLDAICLKYYGQVGMVETVYEVNRDLANHGPVFPSGILIILPDKEADAPEPETIRLWD